MIKGYVGIEITQLRRWPGQGYLLEKIRSDFHDVPDKRDRLIKLIETARGNEYFQNEYTL